MVRVHDVMSVDVITVGPEDTLRDVAQLFAEDHISGAPVVAGGKVVGVISASDLVAFDAAEPMPEGRGRPEVDWSLLEGSEPWDPDRDEAPAYFGQPWSAEGTQALVDAEGEVWDKLGEHAAAELMTRSVASVSPGTDVRDAAEFMLRSGVHRLLVLEEERLVGVLTTTDIVKAVSQHGLGG